MKDKKVLITGSTSGIGLGIAQKFARQGAHIVINGLGEADQIKKIQEALETDFGVKTLFHGADLTKVSQIEDLFNTIEKAWGGVDILVNNAGVQHVAPICDFPPEKWDKIIALDLSAAFHTSRLAIPHMRDQKWGRIVNIASAHAFVASPFKAAYVAAKHGLGGLSKVIALEVAQDNITCNAICPGYVHTPLVDMQIDNTAKARGISREAVINDVMLGPQATKKFVQIEEVASFVSYLCSNEAASITGALLAIDGGWTAH